MRRFLVVGQRATTSGDLNLNDLCSSSGRLDVLLRCINSAFFLSHDLRRDVELYLVLRGPPDGPKCIRMVGAELEKLNPDERSGAALVKAALGVRLPKGLEKPSTKGIYISRRDLADILKDTGLRPVYLHDTGADVSTVRLDPDGCLFVLGDDQGLTPQDESLLTGAQKVSLGRNVLHTHHCITIVHYELDRRG